MLWLGKEKYPWIKAFFQYVPFWLQMGPMVAGVPPREASDRLIIYQNRFDTLYRKYITYTGGEELFGLPVTEYPELLQIRKELNLLQVCIQVWCAEFINKKK